MCDPGRSSQALRRTQPARAWGDAVTIASTVIALPGMPRVRICLAQSGEGFEVRRQVGDEGTTILYVSQRSYQPALTAYREALDAVLAPDI